MAKLRRKVITIEGREEGEEEMKKQLCIECGGTGETWDRTNEEENGADITECEHCNGTGDEPETPEDLKKTPPKTTKKKARGKR